MARPWEIGSNVTYTLHWTGTFAGHISLRTSFWFEATLCSWGVWGSRAGGCFTVSVKDEDLQTFSCVLVNLTGLAVNLFWFTLDFNNTLHGVISADLESRIRSVAKVQADSIYIWIYFVIPGSSFCLSLALVLLTTVTPREDSSVSQVCSFAPVWKRLVWAVHICNPSSWDWDGQILGASWPVSLVSGEFQASERWKEGAQCLRNDTRGSPRLQGYMCTGTCIHTYVCTYNNCTALTHMYIYCTGVVTYATHTWDRRQCVAGVSFPLPYRFGYTHAVRFDSKCSYQLSCLTGPQLLRLLGLSS